MERAEVAEMGEVNPEELPGLTLLRLTDLGRMVERLLESELAGREVSLAELRVLSVCAAHPGVTAVEVSRILLVEPPTVSRMVHPLSRRRLLSRRRSRTDRREVRLHVTTAGLALLAQCQPLLEQAQARLLGSLDEAERGSFRRVVETLLAGPGSGIRPLPAFHEQLSMSRLRQGEGGAAPTGIGSDSDQGRRATASP